MMPPLELKARLTLSAAHGDVMLQAEGGDITLDMPNLQTITVLMRTWPGDQTWGVAFEQLQPWLLASQLTVNLRLGGHTVARLGAQALPNFLARVLQLGPVELRPFAMLWAWWHSRRNEAQLS